MAIVKVNKRFFVRENANFFADKVLHLPSLNEIRDLVRQISRKRLVIGEVSQDQTIIGGRQGCIASSAGLAGIEQASASSQTPFLALIKLIVGLCRQRG